MEALHTSHLNQDHLEHPTATPVIALDQDRLAWQQDSGSSGEGTPCSVSGSDDAPSLSARHSSETEPEQDPEPAPKATIKRGPHADQIRNGSWPTRTSRRNPALATAVAEVSDPGEQGSPLYLTSSTPSVSLPVLASAPSPSPSPSPSATRQLRTMDNINQVEVVGDKAVRSDIPLSVLQQLYFPDDKTSYRHINFEDKTVSFSHNPSFPAVKFLPNHERKRILVTGGAGFVGSHLVDRLMLMGHEVIVLDNFFTGNKKNVQHWLGHPHFELVRHDVVDPFMIEVDQIYHLACPASPPHYQYNPIKTVKTSVMGTINMLGLAKRTKARFLLTSTSEVYGDPEEHPQKETYWGHVNPIGPRACYDEGKRVAETLTYSYMQQDDVDVRVARIFNTFGPRMNENDGRVVSNFIMQALRGDELTIYGDGEQTRSFQYIHDLVDGLILLMNRNYKEPVNLGNPEEYTIREFAELIRDEINADVGIMSLPPTEDDPQRRRPDIGRAQKYLGWAPKFSVGQGIRETVQYFKNTKTEQNC